MKKIEQYVSIERRKRMKKYLVWIGAMILVMALVSPALAQDWAKKFEATSLFQIWSVMVNKQDFKMNAADFPTANTGYYLDQGKWLAINPAKNKTARSAMPFPALATTGWC